MAQSRSGAISGRGYHYQDAVGAWLGLRILTGKTVAERLVPEGLEDLSCEGNSSLDVQVKSRQARVGDFPQSRAAGHILDAWERHCSRDGGQHLVVVFERAIDGKASADWDRTLADEPAWADLTVAVRKIAAHRLLGTEAVNALLVGTTAVVLPQRDLMREAAEMVGARTGLLAGATVPVIQSLRAAVAEYADRNAEAQWDDRSGLTPTDLTRIVTEAAELVDRASLDEAVAERVVRTS